MRQTATSRQRRVKRRRRDTVLPLLALTVVALTATLSYGAQPRGIHGARQAHLSPELSKLSSAKNYPSLASEQVQVIIQFKQKPTLKHIQRMATLGGRHLQRLDAVRAGVYNIPLSALAKLAKDPDVVYVSPNRPVS